ncbi:MAG TPA: hypothetical protein VKS82_08415 [Streptosporangiaceae bacterium]|nr:hypothetical protein [Streptosporangiaceae bacterium]
MNSISNPTAVVPSTQSFGPHGRSFSHSFPANSLTVLTLSTG